MSDIKMIRMVTGEEIIGKMVSSDENGYTMSGLLTMTVQQDQRGNMVPAPMPFSMFAKDPLKQEFHIQRHCVCTVFEADSKLLDMYRKLIAQSTSGLVLPDSQGIVGADPAAAKFLLNE